MTCDQIETDLWRLGFGEPEAKFIINVLAGLGRHYQEDVSQMPPALRSYWQGTLTHGTGDDAETAKESQEMLAEARAELRSERLALVENWMREFEIAEEREPWTVDVTGAERDEFVAMLNDRRMLLALEWRINETDMDEDPRKMSDEARRRVILEIDVLGHFILVTLGPQIHRP